jgi:hypothetical protein
MNRFVVRPYRLVHCTTRFAQRTNIFIVLRGKLLAAALPHEVQSTSEATNNLQYAGESITDLEVLN